MSEDLPEDLPGIRTELRYLRREVQASFVRLEERIVEGHKNDQAQWGAIRALETQVQAVPVARADAIRTVEERCAARDKELELRLRTLETERAGDARAIKLIVALVGAGGSLLGGALAKFIF